MSPRLFYKCPLLPNLRRSNLPPLTVLRNTWRRVPLPSGSSVPRATRPPLRRRCPSSKRSLRCVRSCIKRKKCGGRACRDRLQNSLVTSKTRHSIYEGKARRLPISTSLNISPSTASTTPSLSASKISPLTKTTLPNSDPINFRSNTASGTSRYVLETCVSSHVSYTARCISGRLRGTTYDFLIIHSNSTFKYGARASHCQAQNS